MKMMNMAAAQALADVRTAEIRVQAFQFATHKMELGTRTPHLRAALETIYLELQRRLNDRHGQFYMWAMVSDDETKHTARRIAYKRFLREGMAIMNYLEPDGESPFRYSVADYEEFRDELDTLKAEIEAEGEKGSSLWEVQT